MSWNLDGSASSQGAEEVDLGEHGTKFFEDHPVNSEELLIKRKKSTYADIDLSTFRYPYDYVKN